MGFTYIKIWVCNPAQPAQKREVKVLVDTGAVFSVIPKGILQELNIVSVMKRKFKAFGGQEVERETGTALFQYDNVIAGAPVAFGEEGDTLILGVTALEALGYEIDPVTKKLKRIDLLML